MERAFCFRCHRYDMLSFHDYRNKIEEELYETIPKTRERLEDIIAILSNMENKDVEDMKDRLLELKQMLDKILAGGE